ncbi:hypothetical protein BH20BAC1_BH20BAC1_21130 [soil metagenome]
MFAQKYTFLVYTKNFNFFGMLNWAFKLPLTKLRIAAGGEFNECPALNYSSIMN